jgi:hypothetical protein
MAARAILLVALIALHPVGLIRADDALKLPGSSLTIEDALSKSDTVFKGVMADAGVPNTVAAHASAGPEFNHVKLSISQMFRGHLDKQILAMMAANTMLYHEMMPEVGTYYIFFVEKNDVKSYGFPDPYAVLKVLPATDANIATVKKLISN